MGERQPGVGDRIQRSTARRAAGASGNEVNPRWLTKLPVDCSGAATHLYCQGGHSVSEIHSDGGKVVGMTKVNRFDDGISFTLMADKRSDGSCFVTSPELPFFSAIGRGEHDALKNALVILDPYFAANIPDYVDLRRMRVTSEIMFGEAQKATFPLHMIAMRGNSDVECAAT